MKMIFKLIIYNNNYNSNNNNILNNSDNSNDEYEKREKKKFFNEVLKMKFEKLHSTHKRQLINQKYIWDECKKQNIPKKNWSEFILFELNNIYKYLEIQKREKRNKSRKAPMAVIIEENNKFIFFKSFIFCNKNNLNSYLIYYSFQ